MRDFFIVPTPSLLILMSYEGTGYRKIDWDISHSTGSPKTGPILGGLGGNVKRSSAMGGRAIVAAQSFEFVSLADPAGYRYVFCPNMQK